MQGVFFSMFGLWLRLIVKVQLRSFTGGRTKSSIEGGIKPGTAAGIKVGVLEKFLDSAMFSFSFGPLLSALKTI